jgi:hypothetical protein
LPLKGNSYQLNLSTQPMSYADTIGKAGINDASKVTWREAKFYGSSGEDSIIYKGYLLLTEDRLIFVSRKELLKSVRIRYNMDVSNITSVSKIPLTNRFIIHTNTAERDFGFLKKMLYSKTAQIHIKDSQSFFEDIAKLNPSIKMKC